MKYKQLNYRKRCQIYGLWRAGYTQTAIAKEVSVHKSTNSREFNRNITFVRTALGSWQYKPNYAQTYADNRHVDENQLLWISNKLNNRPRKLLSYATPNEMFDRIQT